MQAKWIKLDPGMSKANSINLIVLKRDWVNIIAYIADFCSIASLYHTTTQDRVIPTIITDILHCCQASTTLAYLHTMTTTTTTIIATAAAAIAIAIVFADTSSPGFGPTSAA